MKAVLYGNLTIDHNTTESGVHTGPGGSVYFMARTFTIMGIEPIIISPYGNDFPKSLLSKTKLLPQKPPCRRTLIFKNILKHDGHREQWVRNCKEAEIIKIDDLDKNYLSDSDILAVAPILDNIKTSMIVDLIKKTSSKLKVLLPQGFFRSHDKKGKIYYKKWHSSKEVIKMFDIIVVSDKDYFNIDNFAKIWSRLGPIVIVTKEEKGCSVYTRNKRVDYKAFEVNEIIDSTGAGDVFAAAFSTSYYQRRKIEYCAIFASAASTLSLGFTSDKIEYTKRDIIDLAGKYKV